jgi:hypothetical protein
MNAPSTTLTDHVSDMRLTYLGAVPHTLFTAMIWLMAGILGDFFSVSSAIIFFIVGGTFIFVGGELLRKLMKAPNLIQKENNLKQFFILLAFTVPLSYPLIYFVAKSDINLFFPAFTILIGAHYLPFVYGYRMKTFGVLSIILVSIGTLTGISIRTDFSTPAYLTGVTLLVFASIHYYQVKKELP